MTFIFPQAFAGGPSIIIPVTIDSISINPTSIDVVCTNPVVGGGAIITGNVFDIDDSALFDSIDVSKSGLVCDSSTNNNIGTATLIDLSNYNVQLTVSTDAVGVFSTDTDSFVQPGISFLKLKDRLTGLITINFRDISVTDGIEPSFIPPDLLPSETGTLTITDHNANVDLTTKEHISIQINGVNVDLEETGVNTGIFTYTVNAEDTFSYDTGTLGLARATINIDFDTDPENGLALVEFTPLEKYADFTGNGVFDVGDVIYKDVDGNNEINVNDIRLDFAFEWLGLPDGSTVLADDFDTTANTDISLSSFTPFEKHADSGTPDFDVGETIYYDADTNGAVSIDDTRIANAKSQGFDDGPVVAADAFDGKGDIIIEDVILNQNDIDNGFCGLVKAVTHPFNISFEHGGMVTAGTNIGVTMSYADYIPNDASLLQMYYRPPGFGCSLITLSGAFDPDSHHDGLKTVDSNPTFDNGGVPLYPLSTIQGNYILGFDVGGSGSGGGGITKGGLVLNALGFVKTLAGGGGGGGNSPPSFGQSSFAIISGGEEGFGGIINDNNVNTLEETKTFKVGEKAVLRFDFTEGGGIGKIEHIGLYANVRDGQKRQDSDAYIYFDPLKSPQVTIHDPNGLFSEANFELLQMDTTKFVLKFDLTFAKPMAKSDLILESWNLKKWSTINKIPNAIEVISSGIVQETASAPIVDTFVEDVTDDQVIPVWVKSNAKWWSDDKIDNDNFISGLEYLVNEGIIKVSLPEGTDNSISEVQPWIKSTAGWWADGMISEDEFITAIEWMITNNIIQVAA